MEVSTLEAGRNLCASVPAVSVYATSVLNKKVIALLIICLAMCGDAMAEAYSIRIDWHTNLRTGPGLNNAINEVAPAGAILRVIGARDNWLEIDRNGKALWIADWVGFTRLEAEQTQVDNCCFLDWRCAGDADWIRGFYAFRNQLCAHPGFAVKGSPTFVAQVQAALDLLQALAPQWYAYADSGLDKIKEVAESYDTGVWVHLRTFNITPRHASAGDEWLASIIVHDACHVHQFEAGQVYYGLESERACARIQLEALGIMNPQDSFQFGLPVVLANIDDPAYQWWR